MDFLTDEDRLEQAIDRLELDRQHAKAEKDDPPKRMREEDAAYKDLREVEVWPP